MVTGNELELGDVTEEREDVGDTVWVADDDVGGDVVVDHPEERVVGVDKLNTIDVAEEEDETPDVADDSGMELEIDDAGFEFEMLHLCRDQPISRFTGHNRVRPKRIWVSLSVWFDGTKTPTSSRQRIKKLYRGVA